MMYVPEMVYSTPFTRNSRMAFSLLFSFLLPQAVCRKQKTYNICACGDKLPCLQQFHLENSIGAVRKYPEFPTERQVIAVAIVFFASCGKDETSDLNGTVTINPTMMTDFLKPDQLTEVLIGRTHTRSGKMPALNRQFGGCNSA